MAFQIAQYYSLLRISSFIGGIWGATAPEVPKTPAQPGVERFAGTSV
jgi:hypothetical protein